MAVLRIRRVLASRLVVAIFKSHSMLTVALTRKLLVEGKSSLRNVHTLDAQGGDVGMHLHVPLL